VKVFLFFCLFSCLPLLAGAATKTNFTLVIDAGHGGHDTGAVGAISKEKNLTLKFALAFGRLVEQRCPDVKVVYTRKTDKFVELYRRAEIANQVDADLFISFHINALPKGRVARGFQTYTLGTSKRTGKKTGVLENLEVAKRENSVIFLEKDYQQTYHGYDPNSPESNIMFEFIQDKNMEYSVELAKYMQKYVCQSTGRQDMGAQQDNLAVLRLTSMPGCLIELGFISTRDEEQYMNSAAAESQYARGVFNAFLNYRKRHGGNLTIPYMPAEDPKPAPARKSKPVPVAEPEPEAVAVEPYAAEQPDSLLQVQPVEAKMVERSSTPTPVQEQKSVQEQKPIREQKPVAEQKPVTNQKPVQESKPVQELKPVQNSKSSAPVFKVQILTSSTKLKASDARFKGLSGVESYQEGGMYKYTVGNSENYQEIYQLRKSVAEKIPQAFIIAFKDGVRTDVNAAIREYKAKKK
jgi:N-acetylmuramoyl-L-alanine amidase